jgi:hypothetical protein
MQDKRLQDNNLNSSSAHMPSLDMFEEALRVRLEAFALDDQAICTFSAQAGLDALESHLELQQIQLNFLLNDIRCLRWIKRLMLADKAA